MTNRISAAAFVCLTVATAALPAQAETDFFAFASVGNSDTEFSPTPDAWIYDTEQSLEIGIGYAFGPHFAIQAGYHEFGELTGSDGCPRGAFCRDRACADCIVGPRPVRVDVTGWSARLRGLIPLGERFAAFASVGGIAWNTSATLVSFNDTIFFGGDLDDAGESLIYGAGLRWRVSDRWGLEVSYEEVDLDIESGKLGVTFRF